MDTVIERVQDYFGVPNILENSRKETIVDARHICVYILSRHMNRSNKELTKKFGFATRPSVIWSCKVVENMIKTNKEWRHDVSQLTFSCKYNTKQLPKSYKQKQASFELDEDGFKITI